MKVVSTPIKDCLVIEPKVFYDERGYFLESFNERVFKDETGLDVCFIQDNQSRSTQGVLRGLHYQRGAYQQAKLVRVLQGEVLDVVVDMRKDSTTYGMWFTQVLSEDNFRQLFVPRGCAHGFLVKSETAVFAYKCDNYYHKESEGGVIYNDLDLAIDWEWDMDRVIVSEKDRQLPEFKKALSI